MVKFSVGIITTNCLFCCRLIQSNTYDAKKSNCIISPLVSSTAIIHQHYKVMLGVILHKHVTRRLVSIYSNLPRVAIETN